MIMLSLSVNIPKVEYCGFSRDFLDNTRSEC
uniref:Uncharacterized protein n=1 Tax=Rhizophora mucronata TaxID=61149 RepID=A0A2P2QPF0_RHIMU